MWLHCSFTCLTLAEQAYSRQIPLSEAYFGLPRDRRPGLCADMGPACFLHRKAQQRQEACIKCTRVGFAHACSFWYGWQWLMS